MSDTQNFEVRAIHQVRGLKLCKTKYGARVLAKIEFVGQPMAELWMSEKQGGNLEKINDMLEAYGSGYSSKNIQAYAILDNGRYVWGGCETKKHSDVNFLEEKFGVKIQRIYQ